MRHDFLDKYSSLGSPLHRLDPRTKLILSLFFLIQVSSSGTLPELGLQCVVVMTLIVVSQAPLIFFWKKIKAVTPIAIILSIFPWLSHLPEQSAKMAFHESWPQIRILTPKIYLSVLILTLMISCTAFKDLLWGLRRFRLPKIATTLSQLVYSYLFIFIDELHRIQRAYHCRTPRRRISTFTLYGYLAAGVFLRSLNRSDSIFKAMTARGFTGEFPEGTPHVMKINDLTAILLFLLFITFQQIKGI